VTHLAYIIPAYALAVLIAGGFSVSAWTRMARARRKLAAIDPRGQR
jgi:hypothetical protein